MLIKVKTRREGKISALQKMFINEAIGSANRKKEPISLPKLEFAKKIEISPQAG
jgi:hypothetical protein